MKYDDDSIYLCMGHMICGGASLKSSMARQCIATSFICIATSFTLTSSCEGQDLDEKLRNVIEYACDDSCVECCFNCFKH